MTATFFNSAAGSALTLVVLAPVAAGIFTLSAAPFRPILVACSIGYALAALTLHLYALSTLKRLW